MPGSRGLPADDVVALEPSGFLGGIISWVRFCHKKRRIGCFRAGKKGQSRVWRGNAMDAFECDGGPRVNGLFSIED